MKPTSYLPLAIILFILSLPVLAGEMRLADPRVVDALRAVDEPVAKPVLTERDFPVIRRPELVELVDQAPDVTFLRTFAEYEKNQGIFMRWQAGNFNAELTQMVVPITTGDSLAKVYLVVADDNQEAHASQNLASAGADMDRVVFVQAPNDSVWIRDYGPRFVSADFQRIIIDHTYEVASRPLDNQVPVHVGDFLDESVYEIPLVHGGGNYHQFSYGQAYATDSILGRNPGMTAEQVKDYYALYQGVDLTLLGSLPLSFDGTQHLDMWFLPVDDENVIIGDYTDPPDGTHPIPQEVIDVTEDAAELMDTRGYTVHRIPGWRVTNPQPWGSYTHITYTNSVIVNDLVITCEFDGFDKQNAQVMDTLESVFTDRDVIAINCDNIIHSSGALHCIVKHKPYSEQFGVRPPYYDWNRKPFTH